MNAGVVIAISRQLGSGGAYVGREVAARLGYRYFDREIVRQAAAELRTDEELLAEREERVSNFWENLLRGMTLGVPEAGYVPPPIQMLYDEELFAAEALVMRKAAEKGNCVIVGRGGFHVLREKSNLVNVFLHADRKFRVRRVLEIYGIDTEEQAAARVETSDKERRKFLEVLSGCEWTDSRNYHLTVDTGMVGFPQAIEFICSLAFCSPLA